jgi:hypothetical protein
LYASAVHFKGRDDGAPDYVGLRYAGCRNVVLGYRYLSLVYLSRDLWRCDDERMIKHAECTAKEDGIWATEVSGKFVIANYVECDARRGLLFETMQDRGFTLGLLVMHLYVAKRRALSMP